ncbi:MAG: DUF4214 domain-containing protein [Solobacterium sp.]|nr:DUF4214 domain-containing protein [Solobacterium sp.]
MRKIVMSVCVALLCLVQTVNAQELQVQTNEIVQIQKLNVSSTEKSVNGFVARLYREVLNREPDTKGFQYWVNQLKTKKTNAAGIVKNFFESNELKKKKLSNKKYINLLFTAVLGRTADQEGLKHWNSVLGKSVSKIALIQNFVTSKEFTQLCKTYGIERGSLTVKYSEQNPGVTNFIKRLYSKCLGRAADSKGLEDWAQRVLKDGYTGAQLVENFFGSQEMTAKKLKAQDTIKLLYSTMLNRSADAKGLAYWTNEVNNGKTIEEVMAGFVASKEFTNLCATYGIKPGTIEIKKPVVEEEITYIPSDGQQMYNYLRRLGYSKAVACGILGNMWSESNFLPYADSGYYYGLCQWGSTRRTNLFNWCYANGYDPTTVLGQMHFMDYELKTYYGWVYQQLLTVQDSAQGASDAAWYFVRGYEGASIDGGRVGLAAQYYNMYAND